MASDPGWEVLRTVGFEVLTAVSTKMAVFWVVAPCSLVEVYRRFGGTAASIIRTMPNNFNPLHTFLRCFSKINFKIISSMPGSAKWSFSFRLID
jgi:hypothetical protein